jgi:hypothetical protein
MRATVHLLCLLLLGGSTVACGQSSPAKPAHPGETNSASSASPAASSPATLEREFFAVVRNGNIRQFMEYVPDDGVNVGRDAEHNTRAEIETQLTSRKGLYCQLFDSSCIQSTIKLDASTPPCSYRELLTQSEKVRTASTETTRNGVRQAILVAEVHNQKCAGPGLIDFIFNYHQSGWKLFSIP